MVLKLQKAPPAHSVLSLLLESCKGGFNGENSLQASDVSSGLRSPDSHSAVVRRSFLKGAGMETEAGAAAGPAGSPSSPGLRLTSPTAFTTGRCRRPIVLNRLKTWETWVLGDTVKGEGFMYGVTSCREDNTSYSRPVWP